MAATTIRFGQVQAKVEAKEDNGAAVPTRLREKLLEPVDAGSLAAFRMGFGLLMFWQALEFLLGGRLDRYFVYPLFHFKYYGFEWLEPLPEVWMRRLFWVFAAACLGIAFGWFYRASAAVFTLVYAYQFLLDEAIYNNHDYLIVLLGLLLTVVPAHATLSIDAWRRRELRSDTVPAWSLWLLRFQIAIPFVYGAIAKVNADWLLRAQPLAIWFANPGPGEWRAPLLYEPWAAYLFSWGGMILDLLAVPALLWRRSRPFAVVALLAFHLLNSQLFVIGVFPWLMMWSLVLFVDPDRLRAARLLPPRRLSAPGRMDRRVSDEPMSTTGKLATALLAIYVGLQLLVPFRHLLYPGPVDWTEEGHQFSWRMKLRDKTGDLTFVAVDPRNREAIVLSGVEEVLTRKQRIMMRHDPDMIRQFAHRLQDGLREKGRGDLEVRVRSSISLNGRAPQPLIDPEIDLAAEPAARGAADWIVPLRERAPEPDEEASSVP